MPLQNCLPRWSEVRIPRYLIEIVSMLQNPALRLSRTRFTMCKSRFLAEFDRRAALKSNALCPAAI